MDDDVELDWAGSDACFELVEEEVGRLGGGCRVVEIFVAGDGVDAIAAEAACAGGIGELEGGDGEERFLRKAGGDGLGSLDKGESRRMCAEELLDGVGVGPGKVGGDERVEEVEEALRGVRGEGVDGVGDDVGVDVLGEVEADGAATGAGVLVGMLGTPAKSESRMVTGVELR